MGIERFFPIMVSMEMDRLKLSIEVKISKKRMEILNVQ